MSLQDITITSSIKSLATQSYGQKTYVASSDLESFPIESITGSHVGAWPNFEPGTNYTIDLFVNVTQSWSGSNITISGSVPFIHNTNDEFFNGEFSGSNYVVTDGNLTDEDCQQFLKPSTIPTDYSVFPYFVRYYDGILDTNSGSFGAFLHRYTVPYPGQLLFNVREDFITVGAGPTYDKYTKIQYVKVAKIDNEGKDNTLSLQELTSFRWIDQTAGEIILNVVNITEYSTYYFYEVISRTWINLLYFGDDNVWDYTLSASSAISSILPRQYSYLTSSWTINTDTANGFSNGQYIFPLTPNCPIVFSASIDLTINTNTTFSLAINGYDPPNPIYVPTATTSDPFPISTISNNSNTYYLSPGNHVLQISSSTFPIQNYIYEIDAYSFNEEKAPNSYLIGTSSLGEFGDLINPLGWSSSFIATPSTLVDEWFSLSYDNVSIPSYPGGVFFAGSGNDAMFRTRIGGNIFSTGETYEIQIEIPSYTDQFQVKYGPPLIALTCSVNTTSPETPGNIIGYIPSGSHGIFSFTRVATATDDGICILAYDGASNSGNNEYAAITRISAYVTSSTQINDLIFQITQSVPPQVSTSSVILEPYLTSNFANSDCDVLINNASLNDISKNHRRVLYDDGSIIPSNIEQIISGTAEYAEVNNYLFNANANVRPRYLGVRTTSQNFNLPSQIGLSNKELANIPDLNNLIINIGTPNVENTTTYFGYFNSLKSNNPIFKGTSSPILKYLIREDGEVFNPSSDDTIYYNIIDSFPRGTKAYTNLLYNTTTIFSSTQSILLSGESYTPILYTISASIGESAYFDNPVQIDFANLQGTNIPGTPKNYDARIDAGWGQLNPGVTSNIWIDPATSNPSYNVQYDTASGFDPNRGTPGNLNEASFEFLGVASSLVDIELTARLYASLQGGTNYKMEMWLERLPGPTTISLGSKSSFVTISSKNIDQSFVIKDFFPLPGDIIYATISNLGPQILLFQFVPRIIITTKGLNIPVVTGPGLWITGSSYDTVLTSSTALGKALLGNYRQADIPSSGFDPIELSCQPKVGDEIRFEYDESLSYRIIDVLPTSSGTNPITYLYLDRTIPPGGFNLDHFTIRRKVKDYITGIALDSNLISQIDEGFLLPEYPSRDLKNNLPKIINDLTNRSLL